MALDKNDIELLRQMVTEVSEEVSRKVCGELIKESETRMMTYMESHLEKKIDTAIEGVQATNDRLDRAIARMDDMNETLLANSLYINRDAKSKTPGRVVKLQG